MVMLYEMEFEVIVSCSFICPETTKHVRVLYLMYLFKISRSGLDVHIMSFVL